MLKYEARKTKTLSFMRVQNKNFKTQRCQKSEKFDIDVNFQIVRIHVTKENQQSVFHG